VPWGLSVLLIAASGTALLSGFCSPNLGETENPDLPQLKQSAVLEDNDWEGSTTFSPFHVCPPRTKLDDYCVELLLRRSDDSWAAYSGAQYTSPYGHRCVLVGYPNTHFRPSANLPVVDNCSSEPGSTKETESLAKCGTGHLSGQSGVLVRSAQRHREVARQS